LKNNEPTGKKRVNLAWFAEKINSCRKKEEGRQPFFRKSKSG
jgi:hypothetical protein